MLAALKAKFDAEPALFIGIGVSVAVFAVQQFIGKGVITADTGQNIVNLLQALAPLLAGILTRSQVSPATNPTPGA